MSIIKYGEVIVVIGKLTEKKDGRVRPVQILVMEGAIWRSTLSLHQPQYGTFSMLKQYTVFFGLIPDSSENPGVSSNLHLPSRTFPNAEAMKTQCVIVHSKSLSYHRFDISPLPSPSSSSSSSVSKPSSFSFI